MKYTIIDSSRLTKILWWDYALGFSFGMLGLFLFPWIASLCALPEWLILVISGLTVLYSIFAFYLANKKDRSANLVQILVVANWAWTAISVLILGFHFRQANMLGLIFILGQIAVVGTLAFLEGEQIEKVK